VKLLLGREDVNPDSSGRYGRTPLSCAAARGHEGIAKLLLERGDVNPSPSDCDRTLLSWAAENGHEGTVKLLLRRTMSAPIARVNPVKPCSCSRTNLAVENVPGVVGKSGGERGSQNFHVNGSQDFAVLLLKNGIDLGYGRVYILRFRFGKIFVFFVKFAVIFSSKLQGIPWHAT